VIEATVREALAGGLGDRIAFDVPMARLTSLRVGGPADAVATPETREQLATLLRICARHRVPHHVVGGGFNVLALDGRLAGVVVRLSRFRRLEERPGALRAEAGVSHSQVTRFCTDRGLSGLEFGAGIPGTIGGWLAMNAGIPEREVKDAVVEVEVMSPTGSSIRVLPRAALRFVYRGLRGLAPGSVLLSALFRVTPSDPATVRAKVEALLARRTRTQPLNVPSCGSVFKNPPGDHAGRLIEAAGLKGFRVGGAQISPVHANFIANTGGATASDVLALIREAQQRVAQRSGQHLRREVRIVGGGA
jgi:UDP-N-acetylmuramate dehydrogenase